MVDYQIEVFNVLAHRFGLRGSRRRIRDAREG
jgi:hypothetical protein